MDGEEFPLSLGKQVKEGKQAFLALGTAYYHISSLNLKTKRVELIKKSRESAMDIQGGGSVDWYPQFEIIKEVIAEPFVQKYMDFFDITTMAARLHNKASMSDEFMKKDGVWFLSMVIPQTYDTDGNVTSVLLANRDVTDKKLRELRQEKELREAKLMPKVQIKQNRHSSSICLMVCQCFKPATPAVMIPSPMLMRGFAACGTVSSHQDCLTTYRRAAS